MNSHRSRKKLIIKALKKILDWVKGGLCRIVGKFRDYQGPQDNSSETYSLELLQKKELLPAPQTQVKQTVYGKGHINVGVISNVNTVNIQPVLATSLPSPPQNIPRHSAVTFVGRDEELEALHLQLHTLRSFSIVTISGMAGVGKSELAIQYAQKQLDSGYYSGGVCWLDASDSSVGNQLVSFCYKSGVNIAPVHDLALQDQVSYCYQHWPACDNHKNHNNKVLIIFDNVADYQNIKPYLPPTDVRFHILMTTRTLSFSQSGSSLDIEELMPESSIKLLQSFIRDENYHPEQRLAAKSICEWLGYLPLGIELVGRYLSRRPERTLVSVKQQLEKRKLSAKALSNPEPLMRNPIGIAAAFDLSWSELNRNTQEFLFQISLFSLSSVSWGLLIRCADQNDMEALEDMRDELLNLHLIKRVDFGEYKLHQLIREFVRHSFSSVELELKFIRVMIAESKQLPERISFEQIQEYDSLIQHLQESTKLVDQLLSQNIIDDEEFYWPFIGVGRFFFSKECYEESKNFYQRCHSLAKKYFGPESLEAGISLSTLASIHYNQKCYSEAASFFEEAKILCQNHLEQTHPNILRIKRNLALAYCYQSIGLTNQKRKDSYNLLKEVFRTRRKLFKKDHPDIASSLIDFASFFSFSQQDKKAIVLLKIAIKIQEKYPSDPLAVADSKYALASIYHKRKDYSRAELIMREEVLSIRSRLLDEANPELGRVFHALGVIHRNQQEFREARKYLRKAEDIFSSQFGESHPETQSTKDILDSLEDY